MASQPSLPLSPTQNELEDILKRTRLETERYHQSWLSEWRRQVLAWSEQGQPSEEVSGETEEEPAMKLTRPARP